MKTYAVVQDGVVENLVDWDGATDWQPPAGSQAIEIPDGVPVSIGWSYSSGEYTAPSH